MYSKHRTKDKEAAWICVQAPKGLPFKDGKKSHWFKVYDSTPEEVQERIIKAINQ